MKLTARARYAVTAMLDIALQEGTGPVTLTEISQRQEISLPYLEQLFCLLRRRGVVRSVRGPGGGYLLAREANTITLEMILSAVDEELDNTRCLGRGGCQSGKICLTHGLWCLLNDKISQFLRQVTLAELTHNGQVKQSGELQTKNREQSIVPELLVRHG